VSISRPNQETGVGAQPYGGLAASNQTLIAQNIRAHIQSDRQGTAPIARLPADAAGESIWKIIFKLPIGTVQTRDVIVDDIGNIYQVISVDWGPLVTTCRAQIMQT
jgi:hypothetical protein